MVEVDQMETFGLWTCYCFNDAVGNGYAVTLLNPRECEDGLDIARDLTEAQAIRLVSFHNAEICADRQQTRPRLSNPWRGGRGNL